MGTPPLGPFVALTRASIERFFDNDVTRRSGDLRASFFWLIAFLAPLGVFMPWMMVFQYQAWAFRGGTDLLRHLAIADKTLYLGLAMAASGAIGLITWGAPLVDRRDALLLGVLPLRGRTIVGAKLAGLTIYVGLVAVGMHTAAAVSFGFVLATGKSMAFMARGVAAHFIASCLASLFVLFAITAIQAVGLALVGARTFRRATPVLQAAATAAMLTGCVMLPTIARLIVPALDAPASAQAWVLHTPPAWFAGVYEVLLGDAGRASRALAGAAVWWTSGALLVTVAVYPLAYRRVMTDAMLGRPAPPRAGVRARLFHRLARLIPGSGVRATVQFTVATLDRGDRHRLVLAIGVGLAAVLAAPGVLLVLRSAAPAVPPEVAVLSVPLITGLILLVSLRIAAALPVEPNSAWLFDATGVGPRVGRVGLRYVMYLVGVAAPSMLSVVLLWPYRDPRITATHGVMCVVVSVVLAELLLWRYAGVPGTRAWRPEAAGLRKWWPAYLAGFFLITRGTPQLTLLSKGSTGVVVAVGLCGVALAAAIARLGTTASAPASIDGEDDETPSLTSY